MILNKKGNKIDLSGYQTIIDTSLTTTEKRISGAINELNEKIGQSGGEFPFTETGSEESEIEEEPERQIQLLTETFMLDGLKGAGPLGCIDVYGRRIALGNGIVKNKIKYEGATVNLVEPEVVDYGN